MRQSNVSQKYPVTLLLKVLSEERQGGIINSPIIEIEFSKKVDLPCSPVEGIFISGLWEPVPIEKVTVQGEKIVCEFKQIEAPIDKLLGSQNEYEQYFSNDGWTKTTLRQTGED